MGGVRGSDKSRLTSLSVGWAPGRIEWPIFEVDEATMETLREEEKERVGRGLRGISDLQGACQEGSCTWDSAQGSELETQRGRPQYTCHLRP